MSKTISIIISIIVLCICLAYPRPVFSSSFQKPVIYSYFWPVVKGELDLLNWNMQTPTIIDVPPAPMNPQWVEAKKHWESKGKIILHRVYPFKVIMTENEMYSMYEKNIENSQGIAIDEITSKISTDQGAMFVNVLKKIRKTYPEKIMAVWWAGGWTKKNAYLLIAIRDYADIYLPQLYVSQRATGRRDIKRFRYHLESAEAFAPGITKKMVVGLGMYPKMADDPAKNFVDHISEQIKLLGTDPLFENILGIALYAPVYNTAEDQKQIDLVIKKYFGR